MNNSNFENLNYKLISKCPMCSAPAQRAQVEILDENPDGSILLYSRCSVCGIGLLAYLSTAKTGMYGAAMLTDLKKTEVMNFFENDPITADEVMDYVKNLKIN